MSCSLGGRIHPLVELITYYLITYFSLLSIILPCFNHMLLCQPSKVQLRNQALNLTNRQHFLFTTYYLSTFFFSVYNRWRRGNCFCVTAAAPSMFIWTQIHTHRPKPKLWKVVQSPTFSPHKDCYYT